MRKTYTPAELRHLAGTRQSAFFVDTAAAALLYAADVIEAANAVIAETQRSSHANGPDEKHSGASPRPPEPK